MTSSDGTLTAGDEGIDAQLRGIAALVEGMPPCSTPASVRGHRTTSPARAARRPVPLVTKAAVLIFAVLVTGAGVLVVVGYQPYQRVHGVPVHPNPVPVAGLLAGTSAGPCAGQPPGCGSPEGTAAALASGRWSSFPAGPLAARAGQVEVWTGHELVVWGGEIDLQSQGDPVYTADGAAYDPASRTWRMLPSAPLPPREGAVAAWTGSEMIVVGGVSGMNGTVGHDDAAAYDPTTNSWSVLPAFPLEARSGATAIWTGHQLIVFGGEGTGPGLDRGLDDGAVYTPSANVWTVLPAVPAQPGWKVLGATPAWTGTQLYLWVTWQKTGPCGQGCGYVDERQLGFSLAAGATSWQSLGKPRIETNLASTAWTGAEVLVIGGVYCPRSCPPPVPSGAAFDPRSRTWSSVDTLSGNEGASTWPALWTGRALVNHHANGIGAFDPATQQWRTLPPAPASVAQYPQEPAVWTGRQLLVWGVGAVQLTAG